MIAVRESSAGVNVWLSPRAHLRLAQRQLDEATVVDEVRAAIAEERVSCRRPPNPYMPWEQPARVHPGCGRVRFALSRDGQLVFVLRRVKRGRRGNGWELLSLYRLAAAQNWLRGEEATL